MGIEPILDFIYAVISDTFDANQRLSTKPQ